MSALLNIGKKALPYAAAAAGYAVGTATGGPVAGAALGGAAYSGTKTATNAIASHTYDKPKPLAPPPVPTLDTAANASAQQADLLRRRRGVLANIVGGAADQPAPSVGVKTLLGS